MAKRCENAGGKKVDFSEYILKMWDQIGYNPGEEEIASTFDDHGPIEDMGEDTQTTMSIGSFQPPKVDLYSSRFRGIQVKGFPKEAESKEIMNFLSNHGIPKNLFHNMVIKGNGKVVISDIENIMCQDLIKTINNVKFHDRILECNGVIPLSPLP